MQVNLIEPGKLIVLQRQQSTQTNAGVHDNIFLIVTVSCWCAKKIPLTALTQYCSSISNHRAHRETFTILVNICRKMVHTLLIS